MVNLNNNMNILITGGAGFIGSNLCNYLLEKIVNVSIFIVDNLSTGKINNLKNDKRIKFIKGDVTNLKFLEILFKKYQFDYIFHFAAVASVQKSIDDPIYTHIVNFDSTIFILDIIKKKNYKIKRFIFSSSAAVYGDKHDLPCNEKNAAVPISNYGMDKYACERYIFNYYKNYGIPCTIFRFFNIYGQNQDPNSPYSGVISIFLKEFIENQKPILKIYGDGNQTRDFVYVGDVVKILVNSLENLDINGEVINICTSIETNLLEIIKVMENIFGKRAEIKFLERRSGDILRSFGDNSLLKECELINSFTTLHDGLKQTILKK